jgi:hypothetical protein
LVGLELGRKLATSLSACSCDNAIFMAEAFAANANERGRPITAGTGTIAGVRMLGRPRAELDAWIRKRATDLSRPAAIRRLVEFTLKAKK